MNARFAQLCRRSARLSGFALLAFAAGCASPNVNPPAPKPGTGYVDLYADPPDELSWDVARLKPGSPTGEKLFSQFEPTTERILRFALPPGRCELRIGFLNRVVMSPAVAVVEVREGLITPVQVTFETVGTATVDDKQTRLGGTAYGRYGRGTKIKAGEETVYRLKAKVLDPLPYLVKDQMPYWASK